MRCCARSRRRRRAPAGPAARARRCEAAAVRARQLRHGRDAVARRRDRHRPRRRSPRRVNGCSRPGGRWVCTGTLFFQQGDPAQCVCERGGAGDRCRGGLRRRPVLRSSRQALPRVTGEPARAGRGGRHVRRHAASARRHLAAARACRRGSSSRDSRCRCCPRSPITRCRCACYGVRRVAGRRPAFAARDCRAAGRGAAVARRRRRLARARLPASPARRGAVCDRESEVPPM